LWILLFLVCVLSGSPFAQDGRGVLLAVPDAERARLGFDAGTSTALFVGVRTFEDPALTSVPFAVDDAVDLAHLFAFELVLVTPGRVVLALSGDPEKDSSKGKLAALKQAGARIVPARKSKILQHLWQQSKAAGTDGLFLVGLATHGFTKAGEDYLFARDTLRAYPKETGIRVGLLFEALAEASTPRRFALLDACKEQLGAARGTSQAPPMSQAFHDAIAAAQGQVVLAATTTRGYAYDDTERQNGVFTAAILDGLRGAALDSGAAFVTAGTLADYVNARVVEWVNQHRPSDHQTLGITRNIEGAGAALPLAADAKIFERAQAYQVQKAKAIDKLRAHLDGPLTGETYDNVVAFLNVGTPTDAHLELLDEIETLEDTRRSKRRLAAYVDKYVTRLARTPEPSPGASPPPPPVRFLGKVQVNVNVPVTVYIGDEKKGQAAPGRPLNQTGVRVGRTEVRVEAAGYKSATQWAQVQRGKWTQLIFELKPLPEKASLTVRSNVYGDRVYIDGQEVGSTRLDVELTPGKHTVRIEKAGYVPYEETVELKADQGSVIRATLSKVPVAVERAEPVTPKPTPENKYRPIPLTGLTTRSCVLELS
jgi:hypothetical protein